MRRRYGNTRKTKQQLIQHFRKRWFERVSGDEPPIDLINERIAGNKWQGRAQTNTRTEFDFNWRGDMVTVIYNKKVGTVCTVLPITGSSADGS